MLENLHKICSQQTMVNDKSSNDVSSTFGRQDEQEIYKSLVDHFPNVATTIAFKNHFYHNVFTEKLVAVYNQLPGVSSLVNLAVLAPNAVSYMEIKIAFGARADLAKEGYCQIVHTQAQAPALNGLHIKVIPLI